MAETIKKIDNIYYLQLGVQGENIATAVQFDMSTWLADYPNAHIHILFKPYNSNVPTPVASELDGNILTWRPSYSATAVTGVGYTEVRAIDSESGLVKKSRIIPTSVENSVSGTDGTVIPSPFQEWVNQVLDIKDDAVRAADATASDRAAVEDALGHVDDAARKIGALTAGAHSVEYGAGSDAVLTEESGHYHLEFSLERGQQGTPGGDAVIMNLGAAEFAFHIVDGHLIMEYGGLTPPPFEIDSQGHLIYYFDDDGGDTPTPTSNTFGTAVFGGAVFD